MQQLLAEAHSVAQYNALIRQQHEILVQQLCKIDKLNQQIEAQIAKKEKQNVEKAEWFQEMEQNLRRELERKDEIIAKLEKGVNAMISVSDIDDK